MADVKDLSSLLKQNGYDMELPNHDILKALPTNVKRRVCALKKIQLQSVEVESKFYQRVHELEKEFEGLFAKFNEQRKQIVNGAVEPTAEEADIPIIHGASEEELKELNEGCSEDPSAKGIPEFWLTVLKTSEITGDMIQEHDEEILKYLTDITATVDVDPAGFTLTFHFATNPYFKNSTLTKKYILQMTPDAEEPFDFDGPSVTKSIGSEIEWAEGRNVTKKVIKKKQKKGPNAGKFLTKTVKADSFFNFFDPPQVPEGDNHKNEDDDNEKSGGCHDGCCPDDEDMELLRVDFEIGQILRDQIIPRAVLYFTGEAADGDMFDDEFEDGEDGDDSEGDEDEE